MDAQYTPIIAIAALLAACPTQSFGQTELSSEALIACSKAGVAECQFRHAQVLERNGGEESLDEAKHLYQSSYARGYEPAGKALLNLLKKRNPQQPAPSVASPVARNALSRRPEPPNANADSDPQRAMAPSREASGETKPNRPVIFPKGHAFAHCFRTSFTSEVKGQTKGKPSSWVSSFRTISSKATTEQYLFCFPERGVAGSAMYTGFNWIFLHRNYFGVLHGDVVGKDKKRTRFFYQQTNEPDKKAKEGPAALQVILNAAQEPSDPMEVNVIVLTGHAVEVPISQLSQAGI